MTVGAGCAVHVGREGRGESSEAPARRPRGAGQYAQRPRTPPGRTPPAHPPLHLCHVSLLSVQFHSQGRDFLLTEPVLLRVNVLTASLSSSQLFNFGFQL